MSGTVVPFRVIAIVDSPGSAARILEIAHAAPTIGFAMMIRDPGHDAGVVRQLCEQVLQWNLPSNLLLLSNGVWVPGVNGVHWTSRQLDSRSAEMPGHGYQGGSVHTFEDLEAAERSGMDYLTVSPIHEPGGKSVEATLGQAGLSRFATRTTLPLFALGGVTAETAAGCLAAGAYGLAAISWFQTDSLDRIIDTLSELFTP